MSAHAAGLARRSLRRDVIKRDDGPSQSAFYVSDISPVFQYAQAATVSTPSTFSPWTAGYAAQSDGFDETLHYTSTSNSTLSFNVTATSISLLVPSFASCTATMSINGSSPVPACATSSAAGDLPFTISNLPAGSHAVQWNSGVVPSGAQVVFWGVQGMRPARGSNITIDDSYTGGTSSDGPVKLQYTGTWQHDTNGQGSAGGSFQKTISTTSSQGAQVSFSSSGSAVYIYGPVGPDLGTASVALNGQVVASSLNLTSSWPLDYGLLWFRTGLDPSTKTEVTLTNLQNKKMGVDFFILSAEPGLISSLNLSPTTTPFTSTLAGKLVLFMLVPLLALVGLGLLVWLFIRRRREQRAFQANRDLNRGSGVAMLRTDGLLSPSEYSEKGTYSDYASARTGGQSPYSGGGASSAASAGGAAIWDGRSTSRFSDRGRRDRDFQDGEGEVFVSYDSAKSQRMSDRWNRNSATTRTASPISPASEGSTRSHALSPQPSVSGLSDGRRRPNMPDIAEGTSGSVENLEGTAGLANGTGSASHYRIWSAIQSLLAAPPSIPGSAIPATALPAYSPEDTNATWHSDLNGSRLPYAAHGQGGPESDTSRGVSPAVAYPTKGLGDTSRGVSPQQGGPSSGPNGFPSAFDEKAQQLLGQSDSGGKSPQRPSPTRAPRTPLSRWTDRASSVAPSSIISMFGAPPSARDRDSVFTAYTGPANSPGLPVPPMPARPAPTVDTTFHRDTTAAGIPISALHSPVTSALSRETHRSGGRAARASPPPGSTRSGVLVRSVSSTSSRRSAGSARPDSSIMPI